jgi:hypothetical protein
MYTRLVQNFGGSLATIGPGEFHENWTRDLPPCIYSSYQNSRKSVKPFSRFYHFRFMVSLWVGWGHFRSYGVGNGSIIFLSSIWLFQGVTHQNRSINSEVIANWNYFFGNFGANLPKIGRSDFYKIFTKNFSPYLYPTCQISRKSVRAFSRFCHFRFLTPWTGSRGRMGSAMGLWPSPHRYRFFKYK